MTRRWLSLICFAAVLPLLASCKVYYARTETVGTPIYIRSNVPSCPVKDVALAVPTVGMFLGVSGYEPDAGVYSTPAHFIGASLFAGLFGRAGDASGPGMYSSTSLTDVIPRDQLPKGSADPLDVVRVMGYGGGGSSELLRRARIESALADAIVAAEKKHEEHGRVQLVIYVAAHGFLGTDGQPYFLPADASAQDPSTWISYRSVVESVQKFLERNAPGAMTRTALVLFDTCQISRSGTPAFATTLPTTPGLVLVRSAAPGQYAWHWTASTVSDQHVAVVKETRVGIGLPPKAERGHIHREISSTMSVLPLANQCSLADAAKAHQAKTGAADQAIAVHDWFAATKKKADDYLAQIPEMQQLNRTQEISMAVTDADAARPLFVMRMPNAEDQER
jgi:hypothetical protein